LTFKQIGEDDVTNAAFGSASSFFTSDTVSIVKVLIKESQFTCQPLFGTLSGSNFGHKD